MILCTVILAASYYPSKIHDLEIFMAYDKPWDEDFQDVPGTQQWQYFFGEISFP